MIDKEIEHWVRIVNEEFGLSDKNEASVAYFKELKPIASFVTGKGWYLVYSTLPDMWGNIGLYVHSFYVMTKNRGKGVLQVIHTIFNTAKILGCKKIVMGCHLGNVEKFNKFLKGMGFKPSVFVKEI